MHPSIGAKAPRANVFALASALVAGALGIHSSAATACVLFDIPAAPIANAVVAFGEAADVPIIGVFPDQSIRSHSVHGCLDPHTALRRLLLHTGFTFRVSAGGVWAVYKKRPPPTLPKLPVPLSVEHEKNAAESEPVIVAQSGAARGEIPNLVGGDVSVISNGVSFGVRETW